MVTPRKSPPMANYDVDDDGQEIDEDAPAANTENDRPSPQVLDSWPTKAKAAALLGKSTKSIQRLVATGDLKCYMHRGVPRFDPKELNELLNDSDESGAQETIRSLNSAFETSQTHSKQLISMITTPATVLHELLARENKRLTDRVSQLEDKIFEMIEAAEAALTLKSERDLAQATALARQDRLDKMVDAAKGMLPTLMNQIAGKRVIDGVFSRISVENLETLKEAGVLSEDEYRTLVELKAPKVVVSQSVEQTVATQ